MDKCKLLGHKVEFWDNGYPICDRCGAHGAYENGEWDNEWYYPPLRIIWWVRYVFGYSIPSKIRMILYSIRLMFLGEDEIPF